MITAPTTHVLDFVLILWICRLRPKQLRVVRAFKSTLEDLEDRRSVASLHSLRSSRSAQPIQGGGLMAGTSPPQLTPQQRQILKQSVSAFYLQKSSSQPGAATVAPAAKLSYIDDDTVGDGARVAAQLINLNEDLPKPVHETRI